MQGRELLERLARLILLRVERWLDQGLGSCVLRDTQLSRMVEDSLLYFHQHRYELGASVIMPNHVHCIVRPFGTDDRQLEEITGSWKSYTSRRIHGILGKSGVLWQDESYDRIVRDEEHLWQCLQYIGSNPRKVGLTDAEYRLWVNPTWQAIGWKFSR
jgi:REP element-mobilizing transposase RayT